MPDSQYRSDRSCMNEVLTRIGAPEVTPGVFGPPSFYTVFMHLLDRIDALEARVTVLESRPTGGTATRRVF